MLNKSFSPDKVKISLHYMEKCAGSVRAGSMGLQLIPDIDGFIAQTTALGDIADADSNYHNSTLSPKFKRTVQKILKSSDLGNLVFLKGQIKKQSILDEGYRENAEKAVEIMKGIISEIEESLQ